MEPIFATYASEIDDTGVKPARPRERIKVDGLCRTVVDEARDPRTVGECRRLPVDAESATCALKAIADSAEVTFEDRLSTRPIAARTGQGAPSKTVDRFCYLRRIVRPRCPTRLDLLRQRGP